MNTTKDGIKNNVEQQVDWGYKSEKKIRNWEKNCYATSKTLKTWKWNTCVGNEWNCEMRNQHLLSIVDQRSTNCPNQLHTKTTISEMYSTKTSEQHELHIHIRESHGTHLKGAWSWRCKRQIYNTIHWRTWGMMSVKLTTKVSKWFDVGKLEAIMYCTYFIMWGLSLNLNNKISKDVVCKNYISTF